jgi:mannose-6-phosphate isomerase-like protein (cupin superfamily)
MNDTDVERIRSELTDSYPGTRVKIAEDRGEMVAEISDGFAVAVIDRSVPHFHLRMQELYRVLRGTLHVACGGQGYVLRAGESLVIPPGQVHFARAAGDPSWIEVVTDPPWSAEDHFIL